MVRRASVLFIPAALLLLPGRMTLRTIGEVSNSFLTVLVGDLRLRMLMTAVAGIRLDLGRVTGIAGTDAGFAVIIREGMWPVVARDARRRRCGSRRTGAEDGEVVRGILVAADTRLRRALVDVVGVALDAVHLDVLAGEREGALRVVEGRALPGVGLMAGAAIRAELPLVLVVFLVAVDARLRRALVDVVGVALDAVHLDVLAGEREGALRVVEGRALPGVGLMAGAAIRAELPLVLVVFL